ncbi:MAG TPA: alpha-mannosidase, partial [Armatimonadota bacterium]
MLKHPRLTIERIHQYVERFRPLFYSETVPLSVEVAGPVDRIPYADAQTLDYKPAQLGMQLGPRWSTYWFRLRGAVPEAWRGKAIDLLFITHGECLLWRDGVPVQGLNYVPGDSWSGADRKDARLKDLAAGGEVYLEVEAASNRDRIGHYSTLEAQVFERADLALFDPEAWDLYFDLFVPKDLLRRADPKHLTPWEGLLMATLNEVANRVDPRDRSTWPVAKELLKRLYDCRNATYCHELSAIGHAHLDTAWLWPLAETERKAARSFSSALAYMEDYPDYKFSCSQAHQYQWMKDDYPSIFEGIKRYTEKGQWVPVGGTWIEPDCNVPSGESLVRQFLYGKRFFRRELNWDCKEFWNPDVFGYSGALPQIMKGVGIDYFLTQKLSWNQFNPPDHHTFYWEGIDGSRVLTHFPPADTYNAMADDPGVADPLKSLTRYKDHDRGNQSMMLFGHGDGGGGPRKEMLEILKRIKDFQGLPRTEQRGSLEF